MVRGGAPRYRRGAATALAAAAAFLGAGSAAHAATVSLYPVPTPDAGLSNITDGPNGALWFTESNDADVNTTPFRIGEISATTGRITEIPVPTQEFDTGDGEGPSAITSSGGQVWFLSDLGSTLYKITPGASKPNLAYNDDLSALMQSLVPDGAGGVWTTAQNLLAGTNGLLHVPASGSPKSVGAQFTGELSPVPLASDGAGGVWYADDGDYLRHQPASGTSVSYPASSPEPEYDVSSMALDGSGEVWFTEFYPGFIPSGGAIGVLTPGAAAAETGDFGDDSDVLPGSLLLGPDGAMWFATTTGVGRIDPSSGVVQLATIPDVSITDMAFGPDGNLWFVDAGANDVGRIVTSSIVFFTTPTPAPTPSPVPVPAPTPAPTPAPAVPRPLAPRPRVSVTATSLRAIGRSHTLLVDCRLTGAGRCVARLTVTARIARGLGLKVTPKARSVTLARASHSFRRKGLVELTLRIPAKTARRMARRRLLVVELTVSSSATGDRTRTVRRALTLRHR